MSPIQVRAAEPADIGGMARVRVDTWRTAYRDILPAEYLAGLSYEDTARRWSEVLWDQPHWAPFAYVAEDEQGKIVGIAMAGPERMQDPLYKGEVYVLYVLEENQHQGIGRRLISACARRLRDHDIHSLLIWVLASNPNRRFYESLGGKVVRKKMELEAGREMPEVGYGWEDTFSLV